MTDHGGQARPEAGVHRSIGEVRRVRLKPMDILQVGLLGIRTRKLRAALSALGISIGITTMVVVMGIPASSQAALAVMSRHVGRGRVMSRSEV